MIKNYLLAILVGMTSAVVLPEVAYAGKTTTFDDPKVREYHTFG